MKKEIEEFKNMVHDLYAISDSPNFPDKIRNMAGEIQNFLNNSETGIPNSESLATDYAELAFPLPKKENEIINYFQQIAKDAFIAGANSKKVD